MYLNIVFLHSYEDSIVAEFLDDHIEKAELFQHLIQWDYGDCELGASVWGTVEKPWGSCDTVREIVVGSDTYYLSCNFGLGYVGLARKITE